MGLFRRFRKFPDGDRGLPKRGRGVGGSVGRDWCANCGSYVGYGDVRCGRCGSANLRRDLYGYRRHK